MVKIAAAVVFVVVMLAVSRLVAKPLAESYGLVALAIGAAVLFPIAFWIDARDKRKRSEADRADQLADIERQKAAIHDEITRSSDRNVIDAEFTVIEPGGRRGK